MIVIPLHNRAGDVVAHTVIDDEDASLAAFSWSRNSDGYVQRDQGMVKLHREVLGLVPGDGLYADHKNLDKLDNRRSNLRVATPAQNAQNLPRKRGVSSAHRGVSWHAANRKWRAYVVVGGKGNYLGYFDDELAAAKAASDFRREHMPFAVEAAA